MEFKDIKELLDFDALDVAEKLSKDKPDAIPGLGLGLFMLHNQMKKQQLSEIGDSHFNTPIDEYEAIVRGLGFRCVYQEPFTTKWDHPDCQKVWWHDQYGILLNYDTYNQKSVNGGKFYYNWKPFSREEAHNYTSSGGYTNDVWVGDHDCREAIKTHILRLVGAGEFIVPWVKSPFLWLYHYGDLHKKEEQYGKGNYSREVYEDRAAKVTKFPLEVQLAIQGVNPEGGD